MLDDRIFAGLEAHPRRRIHYFDGPKAASLSFEEFLGRVTHITRELSSWGLAPGHRVGLLAPNSLAWMLHDLALLRLGVTSVAFPDELRANAAELHSKYDLDLLLVAEGSGELVQKVSGPIGFLDREERPAPWDERPRPRPGGDRSPPSVTFSSGTSGTLKTLAISDAGTRSMIDRFVPLFPFEDDDLFLVFLPFSSYQQRVMVYGCLEQGVDVGLIDARHLFKAFAEFRPTLCLAPPVLFENLHTGFLSRLAGSGLLLRSAFHLVDGLARISPGALRRRLVRKCYGGLHEMLGGRMRVQWTGMAPIRHSTLRFFSRAGLPVYEAYGLNECGPVSCNTPGANRIGSVGRPILPGSVELANDGEILVSITDPVASGYEDCAPGEQESVFLADGRIATGDLGSFDDEGFLYLQGRKKELIIAPGGQKVSPEVIERRLLEIPGVSQTAVFGNGLPGLAAVVVISEEHRGDGVEDEIRRAIEEQNREQPDYRAIDTVCFSEESFTRENRLMTRNLKLDRRAIYEEYQARLESRPH